MAHSYGNSGTVTHFASYEPSNESTVYDYWSETKCGLDGSELRLTDQFNHVTCKNCLKSKQPKQ